MHFCVHVFIVLCSRYSNQGTSCRSNVVLLTFPPTCNGKRSRKRRLRTGAKETAGESKLSSITSLGNNVISDTAGCAIVLQPTDLTGDAGLGPFTDNGTPGNGHFPLLATSPAIDAANNSVCPQKDQIGQPRKPHCDIGAIEFSHHLDELVQNLP